MIEKLEDFIINKLFKKCDKPEKFEKNCKKLSLYCFVDKVLFISSTKHFWLCECPVYSYNSDMKNFCDACLLYRDLWTFSLELDDILQNDVFKILHYFLIF